MIDDMVVVEIQDASVYYEQCQGFSSAVILWRKDSSVVILVKLLMCVAYEWPSDGEGRCVGTFKVLNVRDEGIA